MHLCLIQVSTGYCTLAIVRSTFQTMAIWLHLTYRRSFRSTHDGDEYWIEWVSTLAAYDNLAWWYLPEEPRVADYEAMRCLSEIVHEYDPQGRLAAAYFGTTHLA
jgi:hypothetical protein